MADDIYRHHESIEKKEAFKGVWGQYLGGGRRMNVMHWNFVDGVSLPEHSHESEQFGYIIKGGFKVKIGARMEILKAGDAYFVPANEPHSFTSVGETEAIDVFSPLREVKGYTDKV
ncbi:MAG TPA: cupin domain-containing protein [Elusimicrobiota bacterium]|nr:cupin domain-containing protein [Elusimicrobiota bacterium]